MVVFASGGGGRRKGGVHVQLPGSVTQLGTSLAQVKVNNLNNEIRHQQMPGLKRAERAERAESLAWTNPGVINYYSTLNYPAPKLVQEILVQLTSPFIVDGVSWNLSTRELLNGAETTEEKSTRSEPR